MTNRIDDSEQFEHTHGFGSFLRTLLTGIPWSERAESEEQFRLDSPASGVLRLHNANGRIRIIGDDRNDIDVVATKHVRAESTDAAKRLLEEIRLISGVVGDALELEVDIPKRWNRRGYINLELLVPHGVSVEVSASNGKVIVENLRGAVRARSSNGSVEVTDVIGDVEISTSNARVSCSCTCGRLVARSSNGKIELRGHRGSVDASTSNGLIRASMEELGKEGVCLATSNGRILLELPEDVDGEVDIRVDNGIIRNDRSLCKNVRESNGAVRGRLGNGGAPIKLRTSNGSISLR